jgi:hypothetical protein
MRNSAALLIVASLACAPSTQPDAGPGEEDTCGDGELQDEEECEVDTLDDQTCQTQGFEVGTLACGNDCRFDLSGCSTCRDGQVTGDEVCDATTDVTQTCSEQGFVDGVVTCAPDCTALRTGSCNPSCADAPCESGACVDDVCRQGCTSNDFCFPNESCFLGACLPRCDANNPCESGLPCNTNEGVCTTS